MLFKKSRIPRGYMLLEDIKETRPRSGRSWLFWLTVITVLFLAAFLVAELAAAGSISSSIDTTMHV